MLWLISGALAGTCAVPRSVGDLAWSMDNAEAAWSEETATFVAAVASTDAVLTCVIEPIGVPEAARIHRIRGLLAFVQKDVPAASLSFAAARLLDSTYTFPEAMVAAGSPVDTLYRNARAADTTTSLVRPKAKWSLLVDGTPGLRRRVETPIVLQVVDNAGRVVDAAWLAPSALPPAYPTWRSGLRAPLLGVGAGLAAIAAGTAVYGATTKPEAPTVDDVAVQNALGATSIGLGVASLGFVGAAFVVGRW